MDYPIPNNNEKHFPTDKLIVSKTDLTGRITYGNKLFIEMSGYSEIELLGAPHNLIRHPDMPAVVFKLLWDTIKTGEEINAYVKNLAKDGSYYWVFANVTPSYRDGKMINYLSVRRHPSKITLDNVVAPLYKTLLEIEKSSGISEAEKYLMNLLSEKGVSYEELILSI